VFLVLCVAVVTGSYAEFLDYLKASLTRSGEYHKLAFEFMKTDLLPALQESGGFFRLVQSRWETPGRHLATQVIDGLLYTINRVTFPSPRV
jgi:hypothetical protein